MEYKIALAHPPQVTHEKTKAREKKIHFYKMSHTICMHAICFYTQDYAVKLSRIWVSVRPLASVSPAWEESDPQASYLH